MAFHEPSGPKGDKAKQTPEVDDREYDPTAEALVDEMDDERTLDEEEALDSGNVQNELDDLKNEAEMPIEQLMAYYQRMREQAPAPESEEEDEEEEDEEEEEKCSSSEDDDVEDRKNDSDDENKSRTKLAPQSSQAAASSSSTSSAAQTQSANKQQSSGSSKSSTSNQQKQTDAPNTPTPASEQPHERQHTNRGTTSAPEQESLPITTPTRQRHPITNFVLSSDDSGVFNSLLAYDLDDSEDDEDYSYTDDETGDDEREWRRSIHVGPEHQAVVPDGLSEYDDVPPYGNVDKLMWKCNQVLSQVDIINYLRKATELSKRSDTTTPASVPKYNQDAAQNYRSRVLGQSMMSNDLYTSGQSVNQDFSNFTAQNFDDVYMQQSRKRRRLDQELAQKMSMEYDPSIGASINSTNILAPQLGNVAITDNERKKFNYDLYFQDEEQLLYLLLQCNFNVDEALRRRMLDPFKFYIYEPMSLWSQDECLGFEQGLRDYGKNFYLIRENNVQTRSTAELVAFYYLWKKSERHDMYTNLYKIDRHRCASHPGTTDYMDKFIDDNEASLAEASSSSPSIEGISANLQIGRLNTPLEDSFSHDGSTVAPNINSSSSNHQVPTIINLPQQRQHLQLHHHTPHQILDEADQNVVINSGHFV